MRPISRRADTWALLFALVFPTLATLLYFVVLADCGPGIEWPVYGLCKAVQFGFPLVWVLAVQRRRLRWRGPTIAGLAAAAGFGGLVLVAMLLMYHVWLKPAGLLEVAAAESGRVLGRFGVDRPAEYLALAGFYCAGHSLLEEYYFRWFVFGGLRELISLWPAILISSLGFMGHHVLVLGRYFGWFSPAAALFSLAVAVGGAVWAGMYHRSGSLVGPWLSHAFVDAGIFLIGYHLVADLSGW